MGVERHRHRLPREFMEALRLEVFKAKLNGILEPAGLLRDVPTYGRGVGTKWSLRLLPAQAITGLYEMLLVWPYYIIWKSFKFFVVLGLTHFM